MQLSSSWMKSGSHIYSLTLSFLVPTNTDLAIGAFYHVRFLNSTLVFKWFPQISLSHTRHDWMIPKNIWKSPTQHLTYRPPPPGRCQKGRQRLRGPQSSDKKARNGQPWMDFQCYIIKTYLPFSIHTPHALTHCTHRTLSSPWRYLSHPLLLSHKAFSSEPCRCSLSPRQANHILTFQQTGLIIILGVIELRRQFKRGIVAQLNKQNQN